MIISVWGNNGSGTSTLALKLALAFAKKEKNVVVIDTNFVAPQAKIWFPKTDIGPEKSLSTILANNIELDNVAGKITMINEHLGFLGYGKDLSVNAIPNRDDTPATLLSVLRNIADVIIVDCQANITQDIMSFIAVDLADIKILSISPDLRGLAWYESNVNMLREKWDSQGSKVIKVFNKAQVTSPVDSMERVVGNVEYYFPYYSELEEELYTGTIGTPQYKGRAKKYGSVVASLCNDIEKYYKQMNVIEPPRVEEPVPSDFENRYYEESDGSFPEIDEIFSNIPNNEIKPLDFEDSDKISPDGTIEHSGDKYVEDGESDSFVDDIINDVKPDSPIDVADESDIVNVED